MTDNIADLTPEIQIQTKNGELVVDSRHVAESFGKQHSIVLRAMRNLECSAEFRRCNFASFKINGLTGEVTSHYEMTRDGFTFLAMGFTGKDAAAWKEKYIAAFNAMERAQSVGPVALDLDNPIQLRGLLANYAERTEVAEARVIELEPKAEAFDLLDSSEGSVTLRVAAKTLETPERKFIKWLEVNGWCFRQSGRLQAYADRRKQGFLEHKLYTFTDPQTGIERTKYQVMVTPRGMARLASIFGQEAA